MQCSVHWWCTYLVQRQEEVDYLTVSVRILHYCGVLSDGTWYHFRIKVKHVCVP